MTLRPAPKTARRQLDAGMDEDSLLTAIVEAALFRGWRVFHVRRSDKALTMGTPGFPDVVLARRGRVLFWELKSAKGQLDAEQFGWALAIRGTPPTPTAPEWRVITPADLDAALEELARP